MTCVCYVKMVFLTLSKKKKGGLSRFSLSTWYFYLCQIVVSWCPGTWIHLIKTVLFLQQKKVSLPNVSD